MQVMWEMDTMDLVDAFIRSLPDRDAIDARSMINMAVTDSIEQEQGLEQYEYQAMAVIDRCR